MINRRKLINIRIIKTLRCEKAMNIPKLNRESCHPPELLSDDRSPRDTDFYGGYQHFMTGASVKGLIKVNMLHPGYFVPNKSETIINPVKSKIMINY